MNNSELKIGDRVMVTQRLNESDSHLKKGHLGTIMGFEDPYVLVKFDNFKRGHAGGYYYPDNNIEYDKDDKSHWWMYEWQIMKIGGHLHGKKSTAKQPDQSNPSRAQH